MSSQNAGRVVVLSAQGEKRWSSEVRTGLGSLLDSTLLIVGFGSIGQELAARARAFGARVEGMSRSGRPHPLAERMHTPDQLLQALGTADFVVLALPSTDESRGLFGTGQFAAVKRSAVFVNVARGDIVDTEALAQALHSRQIRAALAALQVVPGSTLEALMQAVWTIAGARRMR